MKKFLYLLAIQRKNYLIVLLPIILLLTGCGLGEPECVDPPVNPGYEIIVSSCRDARVEDVSSDGRYALVSVREPAREIYLIDLETYEQSYLTSHPAPVRFLDSNIALINSADLYFTENEKIISGSFSILEDISELNWLFSSDLSDFEIYIYDEINKIYIIGGGFDAVDGYVSESATFQRLIDRLNEQGISYQKLVSITHRCYIEGDCVSHDGKFYTGDFSRIYMADGGIVKVGKDYKDQYKGWAYDDERIVIGLWGGNSTGFLRSYNYIPGAVAVYTIPDEFLDP